ncbi:unnamed protein product [Prorocentrum cordatum]|uniref:Uncharacterized protein n=2 Tax=Prorocentrum cordatum TaxID=2364126 RepID=A0ABN9RTN7_9DINO|nr:unnamed protein product [Polarella glacialis]
MIPGRGKGRGRPHTARTHPARTLLATKRRLEPPSRQRRTPRRSIRRKRLSCAQPMEVRTTHRLGASGLPQTGSTNYHPRLPPWSSRPVRLRGFIGGQGWSGSGNFRSSPSSPNSSGIHSGCCTSSFMTGPFRRRRTFSSKPCTRAMVTSATFREFSPGRHLRTSTPLNLETNSSHASLVRKL